MTPNGVPMHVELLAELIERRLAAGAAQRLQNLIARCGDRTSHEGYYTREQ